MRKKIFGRQLQRDINERKALFKSLMTSLILKESIKTTEAKAKAIRAEIEKLTTKAKTDGQNAERALSAYFAAPVMRKLINEIAPRFATRPGGYTSIIKTGNRLRDNAKMVVIEWVEKGTKLVKGEVVGEAKTVEKVTTVTPKKAVKKETKPKAEKSPKGTSYKVAAKEEK